MARRTDDTLVRAIIDFDTAIENLDPFIEASNQLVTEICAPAGYDADRLEMIERWLAAHFIAVRDPRYASQNIGQAGGSYQGQVGMNLSLTTYGQQAMLLDTKGGLAWLDKHITQGKRARVGITYLGDVNRSQWYSYPWLFRGLVA